MCLCPSYISLGKKQVAISSQQFGFCRNRSTELAATLFLNNIRKEMDNGNLTGAVLIDLSKAFHTIALSYLSYQNMELQV